MTSELLAVIEYFEKEKGIDRETMVEALENALLTASKKSVGPARELRMTIDPEKGSIKAIAKLIAVEEVTRKFDEIPLAVAKKIHEKQGLPEPQLGDEIEVNVTPADFGRIAAQTAKQHMMQQIRQAEKANIYEAFKDRAGDIVSGTVRRFEKSDVMIDLGKFEGIMPSRERVSTEEYNVGDRIRAYVVAVENGPRGPEIILSRSHPNFVRRLFEFEVSEIADHTVEIRGIAREPGFRTKVAVYSGDDKVDPVGACVGLRGARVKNIVRELNNEKVDIIRWSENIKEFVTDALKPAIIRNIELEPAAQRVRVTVDEEELSKAIGRRGQNARLTSRLIGWDVQVQKDESAHEAFEQRIIDAAKDIVSALGIESEVGVSLVRGGLTNVDSFSGVDASDIADILGGDTALAEKIYAAARAILDASEEESASGAVPA
ncbi:MAG: N utilization substance protein A [Pseudoalteromonas tetraodonis]|jgi:N utilization substance protein A